MCSHAAVSSATAERMTADKSRTQLSGTTASPVTVRDLDEQYWITMARTADLIRKLTSLADRYDAVIEDGDAQDADRGQRVALMRATAESGRRLIRSLAPPALSPGEQPAPSPVEPTTGPRRRDDQAPTYALIARLEGCAVVRQAQGILMVRADLTAGEAFEAMLLSAAGPRTLDGVADHVVRHGVLPPRETST